MNLIPEDNGLEFKEENADRKLFQRSYFMSNLRWCKHTHIYSQVTDKEISTHTHTRAQIRYFSSRFHIKPGHEKKPVKTDGLRRYILHLFYKRKVRPWAKKELIGFFFVKKRHKEAIFNELYIFTHHCWTPPAKFILSWITWINANVSPQATRPFLQNQFTGIF